MRKIIIGSGTLLFFVILALNALFRPGPGAAAQVSTSTPTSTRTSTPTPKKKLTPTLTPTPTPVTGKLKSQLFFGGLFFYFMDADLGPSGCPKWDILSAKLPNPSLPHIEDIGREGMTGRVCVYGIPSNQPLEVDLYRPDGELADSASIHTEDTGDIVRKLVQDDPQVTGYVGSADIENGIPVFSLDMWWPPGLMEGKWKIDVSSPGNAASGKFKVNPYAVQPAIGLDKPHVGGYPASSSPFQRPPLNETGCRKFLPGDSFTLFVVNLNPQSSFQAGRYQSTLGLSANLIETYPFNTNKKGNQKIQIETSPGDPLGAYFLVLALNPESKELKKVGPSACYELVEQMPLSPLEFYVPLYQLFPTDSILEILDFEINPDVKIQP